jgi:membrane-associated HD superfamily phosphohydrolase
MANKRARISDRNPLTATDGVIAGYEQVNKSASQQSESDLLTSGQVSKSASQQAENIASQQTDKLTSQNELAETDNTSDNSATEEVSKPTSQQSDNLANQEVNKLEVTSNQQSEKSTSQQANNIESQQVSKPIIRKATFQVDAAILADLDRYHLQLQMQMGRRNAPYKEILVEEAIAQWLERAAKSPDRAVKSLLKRQEQR